MRAVILVDIQRPTERVLDWGTLLRALIGTVIRTLARSLPPAPEPDLPQAVQDELAAMAHRSDEALWAIARSTMNRDALALSDVPRDRKEQGSLTPEGQPWLARLTQDADALAVRKAHAYALLKRRGHQVPTLAELPLTV
ncbi:hypothetical protein [Candidatus Chloroploca asiatica]|nr:hypothetical protein [Candidatus Chloroploca asiatica]